MVGAGFLGFYGMLAYRGMNVGREQKVGSVPFSQNPQVFLSLACFSLAYF